MGSLRDGEPTLKREPATPDRRRTGSRALLSRRRTFWGHPRLVFGSIPAGSPHPQMLLCVGGFGDSGVRKVAVRTHTSPPEVAEGPPAHGPGFARAVFRVHEGYRGGPRGSPGRRGTRVGHPGPPVCITAGRTVEVGETRRNTWGSVGSPCLDDTELGLRGRPFPQGPQRRRVPRASWLSTGVSGFSSLLGHQP